VARIAEDNPAAARRLRQEVEGPARMIGARPAAGRRHPALIGHRYRLWALTSFPYLLVYDPSAPPPQIIRFSSTRHATCPRLLADLRS
jgi:toxin ParE1/3/4